MEALAFLFPSVSQNQPAAESDQSQPGDETTYWHEAFGPPTWPNWALVIVGIGAIAAAIRTLKVIRRQAASMRRQTKYIARQALSMRRQTTHLKNAVIESRKAARATRDNAKAALLNAQAVINAERPWLLVDIRMSKSDPDMYILFAINKGKTPAEMQEGHYTCEARPVTGEEFIPPDDFVAPFFRPIQTLTVAEDTFEIGRIKPSSFPKSTYPPTAVFAYGRILYWDTFTDRTQTDAKPHVTQWCLTFDKHRDIWHASPGRYPKNS